MAQLVLVIINIIQNGMSKYGIILFAILLINIFIGSFYGQHLRRSSIISQFMRNAATTDLLYINDTIVFLMNKSPLRVFPEYKNLFNSYELIEPVEVHFEFGSEFTPFGNTTYQIIWSLRNDQLYISDIVFYSLNVCDYNVIFPNNEQYSLLENLTKVKFDKKVSPLSSNPFRHRNKIGMMPATWFNDTIQIKISRGQYLGGRGDPLPIYCADLNDTIWFKRPAPSLEFDKWIGIPCEDLVFRNGKLVSRMTTDVY